MYTEKKNCYILYSYQYHNFLVSQLTVELNELNLNEFNIILFNQIACKKHYVLKKQDQTVHTMKNSDRKTNRHYMLKKNKELKNRGEAKGRKKANITRIVFNLGGFPSWNSEL